MLPPTPDSRLHSKLPGKLCGMTQCRADRHTGLWPARPLGRPEPRGRVLPARGPLGSLPQAAEPCLAVRPGSGGGQPLRLTSAPQWGVCAPHPGEPPEERQSQDPAPGGGWLAPKRGHVTGFPGHARAPGTYARSEGGRVLGRLGPAGCSAGNRPGGALEGPRVLSDPRAPEGPLPGGSGRSPELDATSDTCRAAGGRLPRAGTLHAGLAGTPTPPAPVRPCMRQCWLTWAARRARRLC